MRLACPCCGERSLDEFTFLGDASVTRPDPSADDAAGAFHAYAYLRRNAAGPSDELWFHNTGCHAWLVVTRDTRTHEILGVRLAQDVALARTGNRKDVRETSA
ncbi:MAG: sarcosine oxidase subunit delta [Hyphomicrobiaceae bacterium]|nr:sarcosine oxidase subunit delta [Hyphomicrobiaceae bacterium]